jgi:lipid-binding SYLF domain-containing protein
MNFRRTLLVGALTLCALGPPAFAADKAAKQAEVLKSTAAGLEKFYKAKPELKAAVGQAPGYAVFTTYGVSFIVGGSGGTGVAHDNKSGKNTFMKLGSASVGAQLGAAQNDVLVIFKTPAAMKAFVEKGWGAAGGVSATAGAGGKSAGGGAGASPTDDTQTFTLTKNGVEAGVAIAGVKAWKDDELN